MIKDFKNFKKLNEMNITQGQDNDIKKIFPNYSKEKSHIIAEGGNDDDHTFRGAFLVQIYGKGIYRFEDGELIKKVK